MRSFTIYVDDVEYTVEWSAQDGCAWVESITFSLDGEIDTTWDGVTPDNGAVWEKAQKRAESEYGDALADSHTNYGAY